MMRRWPHYVLRNSKLGNAAGLFSNSRWVLSVATPSRTGGRGLGRWADGFSDALVTAPSMRDLIG
jgi:hypothetical protein